MAAMPGESILPAWLRHAIQGTGRRKTTPPRPAFV
jgi:hypothetical protein